MSMTVSLCVIAYNEEESLPGLLSEITAQSYPKDLTEVILVDSGSADGTKVLMEEFWRQYEKQYSRIAILDNPRHIQAAGWNTAIKDALGDIIIRVDAHGSIPPDFIAKNVQLIRQGECVCGGARPSVAAHPTGREEMLLAAESSMFGSSIAGFRRQKAQKQYVNSLFHGAYRREVFEKAGGFNEALGRTEDNELHYRIRQNGFAICQSSEIISYQQVRPTLRGMLQQKFANGRWIGLTTGYCPKCLSLYHYVPFCFVMAMLGAGVLLLIGLLTKLSWMLWPLLLIVGAYAAADLLISVAAVVTAKKKSLWLLMLPLLFPALHIAYGAGTLMGFIGLPRWKKSLDGAAEKEIENVRLCVQQNTLRRLKHDKSD